MHQLDRDSIIIDLEVTSAGKERLTGSGEVLGKGRKLRKFFVDENAIETYAEYLASRTDDNPALFLSERKKRMSVRAMQERLATWCKKLGFSHINVHRLRHSYATRLANAGIRDMVLMELMGHRSLSTMMGYFKLHEKTIATSYFAAMERSRKF